MPVAKVYNSGTGQWEPVLVGDTGPAGADATLTKSIRTETADTTLLAGDANQIVRFNGTSAQTLTVPDVLGVGQRVEIVQDNSGSVTVTSGSGVTLLSTTGGFELTGQNAKIELVCVAAGEYRLYGDVGLPAAFDVQYLVIAGGGGGGGDDGTDSGGGGGAGGYRSSVSGEPSGGGASAESVLTLDAATNYTVTVGAGGSEGTVGVSSIFSTITSEGGGRGSTRNAVASSGGSGGGGSLSNNSGAVGTTNQGFAGGDGRDSSISLGGGGGGGASSAGEDAPSDAGGDGGAGITSSITGSAVGRAGGGAGGAHETNSESPGVATDGGGNGGVGVTSTLPQNGDANTGGGGGGAYRRAGGPTSIGGSGGSGVVILRYPSSRTINIGAGLTGTETTDGSDKVATITAGTGNVSWS